MHFLLHKAPFFLEDVWRSSEELTSARWDRWCNIRTLQYSSGFWDGHQLFGTLFWRAEETWGVSGASSYCCLLFTRWVCYAAPVFSIPSRSQTEIQGESISPRWHLWNNQFISLQAWHQHSISSSVSSHFKKDCPWSLWWLETLQVAGSEWVCPQRTPLFMDLAKNK